MHLHKIESLVDYANICERNLYMQNFKEENEQYLNWLRNFETLDHQKRSRVFYQKLKSKSKGSEFQCPIRKSKGKLSNSKRECLQFWSNYCQKLYSKTCTKSYHYLSVKDDKLDAPITYEEFTSAIKSLKNNKAPGVIL